MAIQKSDLKLKTEAELVELGKELNLELNPEAQTKSAMIASILSLSEVADEVAEEPSIVEAPEVNEAPAPPVALEKAPKRFRILMHNQEGTDSSPFVKVQVNGVMYTLPREVEVIVPPEVVGVLNDAIITRSVQENGVMVDKSARRFPYTILGQVK